jgi:small subunit ribosomal protein S15
MNQVEFRDHFTSDEFIEAGVDNDALLRRMLGWDNASQQELNAREIALAVKRFQRDAGDTGSTPVQVAVLTVKINYLTKHMQRNHKDTVTARSLQILVNRRKKLMYYLKRKEPEYYWKTIRGLDLRLQL